MDKAFSETINPKKFPPKATWFVLNPRFELITSTAAKISLRQHPSFGNRISGDNDFCRHNFRNLAVSFDTLKYDLGTVR